MIVSPRAQQSRTKGENTAVFAASLALVIAVTFIFSQLDGSSSVAVEELRRQVTDATGWFTVGLANAILGLVAYLGIGRYRSLKLGGPDASPEFSYFGWLGMLFAAGMGIGLLFYSVSEPLHHFIAFQMFVGEPAQTARTAMNMTILHWCLHPWAIYALVGIILAWFHFNRNCPLDFSAPLEALGPMPKGSLRRRAVIALGLFLNIFAVLGTVFGVATSLGLGTAQASAGLSRYLGIDAGPHLQLGLITVVCLAALASVVSGVSRGVKLISQLNLLAALGLMLFVLFAGETLFVLKAIGQHLGYYLNNLLEVSTWRETYTGTNWQLNWTLFYWAWWISWSPFVGLFIARISYGRTIGEFVAGVVLVPSLFNLLWMTVFGANAMHETLFGAGHLISVPSTEALFAFLEQLPFAHTTIWLSIVVVLLFFVTSADSGALVVSTITSGGENPPIWQKALWSMSVLGVTAVLIVGEGLATLQTATIVAGFPFTLVIPFLAYLLLRSLKREWEQTRSPIDAYSERRAIEPPPTVETTAP